MERLTMLIDSHLLDNGKLDKEYDLNNKIQLNEYSCMDVPNAVYKKLGELEDVLEKWQIEDLDKFIENLIAKKRELNDILWRMEKELAELKQKAIVPKFGMKQSVFFITNNCEIGQGLINIIITGRTAFEKWVKYSVDLGQEYEDDIRFVDKDEEDIFATREQAEKELKGE